MTHLLLAQHIILEMTENHFIVLGIAAQVVTWPDGLTMLSFLDVMRSGLI